MNNQEEPNKIAEGLYSQTFAVAWRDDENDRFRRDGSTVTFVGTPLEIEEQVESYLQKAGSDCDLQEKGEMELA